MHIIPPLIQLAHNILIRRLNRVLTNVRRVPSGEVCECGESGYHHFIFRQVMAHCVFDGFVDGCASGEPDGFGFLVEPGEDGCCFAAVAECEVAYVAAPRVHRDGQRFGPPPGQRLSVW